MWPGNVPNSTILGSAGRIVSAPNFPTSGTDLTGMCLAPCVPEELAVDFAPVNLHIALKAKKYVISFIL